MTSCGILQTNYIPWKGYFDQISTVDVFILYDSMQYNKNGWRNRNKIKTQNGSQWLTVPVTVPSLLTPINEIKTFNKTWAKQHWSSLSQNYSKADNFAEYKDVFEDFYLNLDEDNLSVINTKLIQLICDLLGFKTKIVHDTEFNIIGDRNERLVNLCTQVGADVYYSGPAAQCYLDEDLFKRNGIDVKWVDYAGYPEYRQRFPPFEHEVSILDLLFNEGKNARDFMKLSFADAVLERT